MLTRILIYAAGFVLVYGTYIVLHQPIGIYSGDVIVRVSQVYGSDLSLWEIFQRSENLYYFGVNLAYLTFGTLNFYILFKNLVVICTGVYGVVVLERIVASPLVAFVIMALTLCTPVNIGIFQFLHKPSMFSIVMLINLLLHFLHSLF